MTLTCTTNIPEVSEHALECGGSDSCTVTRTVLLLFVRMTCVSVAVALCVWQY